MLFYNQYHTTDHFQSVPTAVTCVGIVFNHHTRILLICMYNNELSCLVNESFKVSKTALFSFG